MSKLFDKFSGGQLAAMFIAVTFSVAVPGTLLGQAAVQNVVLQDPNTGRPALVTAQRALKITDGDGPLTVNGRVVANEAAYANFFRFRGSAEPDCTAAFTAPANRAAILKSLFVDTYQDQTPGVTNYLVFLVGANCTGDQQHLSVTPAGPGVTAFNLEPGWAIPAGQSLWIRRIGGVGADIYGFGYTVPANAVPASASAAIASGPPSRQHVQ